DPMFRKFFIYALLKSKFIQQQIDSFTGDETTIMHVGKHVDKLKFAIPDKGNIKILHIFNSISEEIFNKMLIIQDEIQTLSQLRDSLLPKLMSGKIRVPVKNKGDKNESK
ncbi:MAG: hypothetical protein N2201_05745, partial [candidate division WOR-3 bacterium]|nr:hypothetical protein [candidate division WOR-3 bacterium]